MLSFRNFLGLASGDKVLDEKTIWAFKEELTKKGLFEQLFDEFYAFLEENNLIMQVVGFARNAAYNTLTNLVYNLFRYEQVLRLGMNRTV